MRTLVLGGIRSGKSGWAESAIAVELRRDQPVCCLATGAVPGDDREWSNRIEAHRAHRPPHWSTVETVEVATHLRTLRTPVLVDDMGGWLAAAMTRGEGIAESVDDVIGAVADFRATLILVSPEVGLTVVPATEVGRRFTDELGILNQRLADVCDRVVLVIAGQPLSVKEPR